MLEEEKSICSAEMKVPPAPDGDFLPSDKEQAAVAPSQEGVVTRAEKPELPGEVLSGGHRAMCWDTSRVSFIREEGSGGLPRATEHTI